MHRYDTPVKYNTFTSNYYDIGWLARYSKWTKDQWLMHHITNGTPINYLELLQFSVRAQWFLSLTFFSTYIVLQTKCFGISKSHAGYFHSSHRTINPQKVKGSWTVYGWWSPEEPCNEVRKPVGRVWNFWTSFSNVSKQCRAWPRRVDRLPSGGNNKTCKMSLEACARFPTAEANKKRLILNRYQRHTTNFFRLISTQGIWQSRNAIHHL